MPNGSQLPEVNRKTVAMPDDDHNPYEAPPSSPIRKQVAPLSVFEYATAIVAAVSVAILTFFLTCTGIFILGVSTGSVGIYNSINPTAEAVVTVLLYTVPGVFAVVGGFWTLKAFLRTCRENTAAMPWNHERDDSDRARQIPE